MSFALKYIPFYNSTYPDSVYFFEVNSEKIEGMMCQRLWTYFTTWSSASIPDFEQVTTSLVLTASFTDKAEAFFHLLKSKKSSETITHLGWEISSVKKVFTGNYKTYRNLAKPTSICKEIPVKLSFSVEFINNTFDNFNNIYYCFLLSEAAIEGYFGKQLNKNYFATNQLQCICKCFAWVSHLL